jgi:hypothetical protein
VKPGDRQGVPTVAEAVSKAAAVCDPTGADWSVTAFLESFEDDDRPATAVEDLSGELGSTAAGVDPEGDSPAVLMAAAAAFWLATNIDAAEDRDRVLRESAKLAYGDAMPAGVDDWLEAQGVAAH